MSLCKKYKKKTVNSPLSCRLCSSVYHVNCATVLKGVIRINNEKVECCNNKISQDPDMNVASNTTEEDNIIIHIGANELKNLISDVVSANCVNLCSEIRDLKSTILELQAAVSDLRSSLNSKKSPDKIQTYNTRNKTYASVISNKDVIIVKPKKNQINDITREQIKKNVNSTKLAIGVEQVNNIKDGGIIIRCDGKESSDKMKKSITEKLGDNYTVKDGVFL